MATVKIESSSKTLLADFGNTTYELSEYKTIDTASESGIYAQADVEGRVFEIDGWVDATVAAFRQGTSKTASIELDIGETGRLSGGKYGVTMYGESNVIRNAGSVEGGWDGIAFSGTATIVNTGSITGSSYYGIHSFVDTSGTKIVNHGDISGGEIAIYGYTANGALTIVNDGTISGFASIWTSNAGDVVTNAGRLDGYVSLAKGDDSFTSKAGLVRGDILLGEGDDTFVFKSGSIDGLVEGDAGDDTYIIRRAGVELVEADGGGFDTVSSSVSWTLGNHFEEARLAGKKNIDLTGNDNDLNLLTGNAGSNKIVGGLGADVITGGRGNDVLTGEDGVVSSGGGDLFLFRNGSGEDTITDFHDGEDGIDLSGYKGLDDFGDLSGHIKQAGDDVVIKLLDGDQITLLNMLKQDVDAADFAF